MLFLNLAHAQRIDIIVCPSRCQSWLHVFFRNSFLARFIECLQRFYRDLQHNSQFSKEKRRWTLLEEGQIDFMVIAPEAGGYLQSLPYNATQGAPNYRLRTNSSS